MNWVLLTRIATLANAECGVDPSGAHRRATAIWLLPGRWRRRSCVRP